MRQCGSRIARNDETKLEAAAPEGDRDGQGDAALIQPVPVCASWFIVRMRDA